MGGLSAVAGQPVGRRWSLPHAVWVGIALLLLVWTAVAAPAGIDTPLGPRGPDAAPALSVPLPQRPPPPLSTLEVSPKRDRLPDEAQVEVKRFIVTRLVPRARPGGACHEVLYADLCGQIVDDPKLDQLLAELLRKFDHRASVFDLEDVALQVTRHLRGRDYLLDTAFIPPQTVAGGAVNLYILTGRLGKVNVKGNKRYRSDILAWPFAPLIGEPVTQDEITHAILNVWDYPGLGFAQRKARVTFTPGGRTGETDIDLEVFEDPLPINLILSADNAGSQYSGEYRTRAEVAWNNPTGGADQLLLGLTYAFEPTGNVYYNVDYLRPIITPDWQIGVGINRNAFDLGADIEELGISGVSEQAYIMLSRLFIQSFRERLAVELRFSRQNALTEQDNEQISNDQLAPLSLGVDYLTTDLLLAPAGRANQTRLIGNYTHGFGDLFGSMAGSDAEDSSRINADGIHAGARYDKLVGGVIRKQALPWNTDLWLRVNGQWSADFLVPLEQFAIGGPNSVRAYPTAEWLFDKGWFASLEWEFGIPFLTRLEAKKPNCFYVPKWMSCNAPTKLSEALRLSLFVDFAEGWLNDARSGQADHQAVTGIGVGLKFEARNLRMNLSLATPVGSPVPSNDHDPQIFFNIAYQPF